MPLALRGARVGRMAVVGVVLLATLAMASTARAADKPFSIAFSANPVPAGVSIPGAMPAGMTIEDFTVTLRNDTKTQELGSANLTVPMGYTLVSPPAVDRGNLIEPVGSTLRLRNLDAQPGESVTLTVDLRLPCVKGPQTFSWAVDAKQSNDYNGVGNNLKPPPAGTLGNVVTSACALRFSDQPAGAGKTLQIRADAFQPASLHLVTVEAVDGRSSALAQRLTWFGGEIALALGATTYPGQLVQSGPVTASAGLAAFSSLSITKAGIYSLHASTGAPGFAGGDPRADSAPFQIVDVVNECGAQFCSASLGATTINGAPGAGTGLVLLSQSVGTDPVCDGYNPPVADTWYEFMVTADRAKTIVINYTKAQMRTLKNAGALEVCFATPGPDPFPAKGDPVAFDYDGDGGAKEGFVGLLADCPVTDGPCVTQRGPLTGGGAFIEFFVPATMGDPRYH